MEKYGYREPNVTFMKSCVENVQDCGVEDNSVDLVT